MRTSDAFEGVNQVCILNITNKIAQYIIKLNLYMYGYVASYLSSLEVFIYRYIEK